MKDNFSKSRRNMLRTSAMGLGAAAVAGLVPWASVQASDLPRVSEDDSTAKNLKYVHDAASSDARKNSNEFCHNCRYFKGTQSTEWERCDIFPGKAVAAEGWCNVWVAK